MTFAVTEWMIPPETVFRGNNITTRSRDSVSVASPATYIDFSLDVPNDGILQYFQFYISDPKPIDQSIQFQIWEVVSDDDSNPTVKLVYKLDHSIANAKPGVYRVSCCLLLHC